MNINTMEKIPMVRFNMSGRKFMDLRTCDVYYESAIYLVKDSLIEKNMVSLYVDMEEEPEFIHSKYLEEIDSFSAVARGFLLRMPLAIN
jgi:hypothetical protein